MNYLTDTMVLSSLKISEITLMLKQYFTDEELDSVSNRLDALIAQSETLDDLVTEINNDLLDGDDFPDSL